MQSITVPYTTHHCNLYALVGWFLLHIRRQTHWLQVIYKSLLGIAPPFLCSLVTIARPTCSTPSNRYISLVTPKANTYFGRLSFQFSASNDRLERIAKITEVGDISHSLTLSVSCQSSLPIAAAVHSPSENSPSNQLPTYLILIFVLFFCSFAHQYFYLHILICTYNSSVNC